MDASSDKTHRSKTQNSLEVTLKEAPVSHPGRFVIVFAVAMVFHAPDTHLAVVVGVVVLAYALDVLYCSLGLTYKVPTSRFRRLERGVEVSFRNPRGFRNDVTGYVQICIPWISTTEWHAFSVYPLASDPLGSSSVCVSVVGDWTSKTSGPHKGASIVLQLWSV